MLRSTVQFPKPRHYFPPRECCANASLLCTGSSFFMFPATRAYFCPAHCHQGSPLDKEGLPQKSERQKHEKAKKERRKRIVQGMWIQNNSSKTITPCPRHRLKHLLSPTRYQTPAVTGRGSSGFDNRPQQCQGGRSFTNTDTAGSDREKVHPDITAQRST